MPKILVLLTGGTIGSRARDGVIDADAGAAYDLICLYRASYGGDADFDVLSPYNILSENISPENWETLCGTLSEADFSKYDGIIITHGSDTLSYTSALIGLAFGNAPIPIVLVAGNKPLDEQGSNGMANFRNAVRLIMAKAVSGVFTVYQDDLGKNIVYLGTEITEANPYSHSFSSCRVIPFGEMTEEGLTVLNPQGRKWDEPPLMPCEKIRFDKKTLIIRPYPGQDYRVFNPDGDTAAVLHWLYHSSTASTVGGSCSLMEFIKSCVERGIDFYVAPFKPPGSNLYAGSDSLIQAGAIPLYDISLETAYARLMLKYNEALPH